MKLLELLGYVGCGWAVLAGVGVAIVSLGGRGDADD